MVRSKFIGASIQVFIILFFVIDPVSFGFTGLAVSSFFPPEGINLFYLGLEIIIGLILLYYTWDESKL